MARWWGLPKVETRWRWTTFWTGRRPGLRAQVKEARQAEQDAQTALEQAQLQRNKARSESAAERETFNNWLAARSVTQRAEHDPEVLARTRALDALKQAERSTQKAVEQQQQAALDARQAAAAAAAPGPDGIGGLRPTARRAPQGRAARVPVPAGADAAAAGHCRLAVRQKRKGTYWPFVWGFIFFALFAFFVELVPYLPSYGGYVRYVVGIGVTALVGATPSWGSTATWSGKSWPRPCPTRNAARN